MSVAVAYESFAESDKKVAIVTIDRPEALNALTWSMLQQLAAAFRDIGALLFPLSLFPAHFPRPRPLCITASLAHTLTS